MKKLEKLAALRGEPLDWIIPNAVNKHGVVEAGHKLGVSGATISKWLTDNSYVSSTIWQKAATAVEVEDIQRAAKRVNAWRKEQGLPPLEEEAEGS